MYIYNYSGDDLFIFYFCNLIFIALLYVTLKTDDIPVD